MAKQPELSKPEWSAETRTDYPKGGRPARWAGILYKGIRMIDFKSNTEAVAFLKDSKKVNKFIENTKRAMFGKPGGSGHF